LLEIVIGINLLNKHCYPEVIWREKSLFTDIWKRENCRCIRNSEWF